ncbi:phage integrase SAM-like domain-containing protein [Chryseobacterium bernardetii]|uniref:phage integrase SAM-like domain-containing protein n=1 Tax=Chryseobacterium bernardetii TaxID=1241978 RepID=UPI0030180629
MKTRFFLRNPKESSNTIYVRVRIGRAVDLTMATKETVDLSDWDVDNECLLEQYHEYKNNRSILKRDAETKQRIHENKQVNYRLIELRKLIETSYKSTNQHIDSEWLKNVIYPKVESTTPEKMEFTEYCDIFLKSRGTTISNAYKTKVNSIKAIVEQYIKYRKLKRLLLTDIDNDFKNDFENYCINVEEYSVNYFERNFKFIKTIAYHAHANSYPIYNGLNRIKCKTEKTMFVFLTPEELKTIENTTFSEEHLETAKDWLLISCYSGQRVSDFMRFDVSMIYKRKVKNGERYFIDFIQKKTGKQVLLPLSEKIINILNKRNWNFPRKMSEQNYNEHIKKVCELVGIDEPIEGTLSVKSEAEHIKNRKKNNYRKIQGHFPKYMLVSSHIGRRSFASNNFGRIPTPLLMTATGHSTPNMLMKYIGKIDEQQSISLAEYL